MRERSLLNITAMAGASAAAVLLALVLLQAHDPDRDASVDDPGHVACQVSGPACGEALQAAIDLAAPGATITLEPGRVYEGGITLRPKPGASADKRLTITTRGWRSKGEGWDGLVTPSDKPRLAVIRGAPRAVAAVDIQSGPSSGFVRFVGIAFEATPPNGQGDIIRIGSGRDDSLADLPRHVEIREVLIQGDREFGQKRGIAANGRDITVDHLWCEEIFTPGQDSQCIGAWNGGQRVSIRHSYLAAGSENIMIGGAPVKAAALQPSEWTIEDVILHKPLRWKQDARNRAVKNLLELKHGRDITVRRVLAVNNWRAAQSGRGLVIHHTTNGPCPQCGNLEQILIEDLVMLNVEGGVSFQGYSWQADSNNAGRLRGVTLRHAFVQVEGPGRLIEITNVHGRHDIRIERSTLLNNGTGWLMGDFGMVWHDSGSRGPGGAMAGLWIVDNVIAANGEYGVTAPQRHHHGSGLGAFATSDLQIAGNIIGDAPAPHLDNYNAHTANGAANTSVARAALASKLPSTRCETWRPGKGADCARLSPVFALLHRLPEP
jgi:hypothetical protein